MSAIPPEFNPSGFLSNGIRASTNSNVFNDTEPLPNQGGMSFVQKTKILGKWHLIKRLKPEYSKHTVYITNFEREFDIGYHLDHPHIVHYLNKGADDEGMYILMEYIDGRTLKNILQKKGVIKNEQQIKRIALQLLDALSYLHKHQIYHLDLKPENIMLTNKGDNIKLLDFGLSITDSHALIDGGTLKYASPEQISRPESIDGRSDIYSFGILLLELIQGNTDKNSIKNVKGVFKRVIAKCIINDPTERFQSADEIIEFINSTKKRITLIAYSTIIFIVALSIFFYTTLFEKNDTQISKFEVKPAFQEDLNPELTETKSDFKAIKSQEKVKQIITEIEYAEKKTKEIVQKYSDSIISVDDSLKCAELGKKLYDAFLIRIAFYDKAQTITVLNSIRDSCSSENLKQWDKFSSKFYLGSLKYSKALKIYLKAQEESSNKIRKVIFPNENK